MQAELEEIINISLTKALDNDAKGNIGLAYAYYTAVLELCPAKRKELEKRFTSVLCEWGIYLECSNRFNDVIKCYKNSLEMFSENPVMLNNFAAHFLRIKQPLKGIEYLEKALQINNDYLPAERNLQNAYSIAVERWHFPMLNDRQRNCAFAKAIHKTISLGYDTVLDIGTGTGLLSLYAHNAGAKKIFACDQSPVMCHIAEQVFLRHKTENISVICKESSLLRIPQDIPDRIKLIVTEIFDAGLFGELVIPTLIDAHKNLLSPHGIIIPLSATLFIAAIESKYVRLRYSAVFHDSQSPKYLRFGNVTISPDETFYDTEDLNNIHANHITEPRPSLKVDFNDLSDLEYFNKDGVKEVFTVKCRYNGILDGLVAWFKLTLDEEIELDSSQEKSSWPVAVFASTPQNVSCQDHIIITAEIQNGKLKCSYIVKDKVIDTSGRSYFCMPRDVIAFLNDELYLESLAEAAKSKKDTTIESVFDTCPFPIYGLTMMKENIKCKALYYQSQNESLKRFINHIIDINNICGQVHFVSDFSEINCKVDEIFIHNFDMKGELMDAGQLSYRDMYSDLLSPTGSIIPEKIILIGQLGHSESLPLMVSVKDHNLRIDSTSQESLTEIHHTGTDIDSKDMTCDINSSGSSIYHISEYINKFKINQVFDLHSDLYYCDMLSDVEKLIEMDDAEMKEEIVDFKILESSNSKIHPNALICWYEIHLTDNIIQNTRRNNSFMNHMAFVYENELDQVANGENVSVKIQQMRDIVKVKIV
ncbi:hypothetical protein QAD02_003991 [Eretmocerus hayati]|uniref:Uncharacterized protein n=1 Tax=Eretmocerus hayati TaxID=131215 RepID=A0ACC2NQ40_9HYME|nr:hypothetical protein QAD02_003991 [Eretmocerus hayati]